MPTKPVAPVRSSLPSSGALTPGSRLELARTGAERRPHGVEATVHVEDLAADRAREVGEQEAGGVGHRPGVAGVPAERRLVAATRPPAPSKPSMPPGREGAERTRGDQVHAHAVRAQVAREVATGGLERSLGHAHPVVRRPGHGGVEVHGHDRAARVAFLEQREQARRQRLERVGARGERRAGALGRRVEERRRRARRRVRTRSRGGRRPRRPSARAGPAASAS